METPTSIRAVPRYDLDVREGAYDAWVLNGCNAAETARSLGVPVTTVRYWIKADRWRQNHAAELFPVERHEAYELIRSNLISAAIFASEDIAAHHDRDNPFRFKDKVEMDAAYGSVDRVGFGVVRVLTAPMLDEQRKAESTANPATMTADDLARLSPAELRALEQGRSVTLPNKRDQVIEVKAG